MLRHLLMIRCMFASEESTTLSSSCHWRRQSTHFLCPPTFTTEIFTYKYSKLLPSRLNPLGLEKPDTKEEEKVISAIPPESTGEKVFQPYTSSLHGYMMISQKMGESDLLSSDNNISTQVNMLLKLNACKYVIKTGVGNKISDFSLHLLFFFS